MKKLFKMFKELRIRYHSFMLSTYMDLSEQAHIDGDKKAMAIIDKQYMKHLKKLSKLGNDFAKKELAVLKEMGF